MTLKGILKLAIFTALVFSAQFLWPWRAIHHAPGVLVEGVPLQKDAAPKVLPDVDGWKLTAVAEYELKGRALGTKRYHGGDNSGLVPVDVAVGWGRMSDESVLSRFSISMGNRFFFYEWDDEPAIPLEEIKNSAANNHIIAANSDVSSVVRWLRPGQLIVFKGYLVNAKGPGGRTWNSSIRRDDDGNGACELFYVESARAVNTPGEL